MSKFTRKTLLHSGLATAGLAIAGPFKAQAQPASMGLGLGAGLGSLPFLTAAETRSISAENLTGEKGKGGMAIPNPEDPALPYSRAAEDLGQGWKVNPFVKPKAGETLTLMDVDGPGIIQHIWMATERDYRGVGRACILRFYWDDEETPSVEVPMTDFFAVGHDLFAPVTSAVVANNATSALNCYWPMPFRKHARVTFTNELGKDLNLLAFQITYSLTELPEDTGYFHAQWRRSVTERSHPVHTILDGVRNQGRYAGTFLSWTQLSDGWFGEGEVKFYLDGDDKFPTICGTGTEDYFGASYGFPEIYSTAYLGNTLDHKGGGESERGGPPKWSLYRWHIMDPICFQKDLRVTIQALGWWPTRKYQPLADDIASVAYWYQKEPHGAFPKLPPLTKRWPR